jgi:hypothetical protein
VYIRICPDPYLIGLLDPDPCYFIRNPKKGRGSSLQAGSIYFRFHQKWSKLYALLQTYANDYLVAMFAQFLMKLNIVSLLPVMKCPSHPEKFKCCSFFSRMKCFDHRNIQIGSGSGSRSGQGERGEMH